MGRFFLAEFLCAHVAFDRLDNVILKGGLDELPEIWV